MSSQLKATASKTSNKKCNVCGRTTKKESIVCCTSKRNFDLNCGNISEKRFNLMTTENKQKWKCDSCIGKKMTDNQNKKTSTLVPQQKIQTEKENELNVSFDKNITIRKPKCFPGTTPSRSNQSIQYDQDNSFLSIHSQTNATSLPDLSIGYDEEMITLKDIIKDLNIKLESAHLEIENLNLTNNKLKNLIQEKDKKIRTLTDICFGSTNKKKGNTIDSLNEIQINHMKF
ncbi:unnamed protein product [Diatraea saccharalis]|uniref:PHD-type domain-containing protein n=1 Tax=Diatraea saccharalis TaxID=40085 RepID=A0A9N9WGV7_9NEOP|nr:unnamed protein product [Diatraea saccharalis]